MERFDVNGRIYEHLEFTFHFLFAFMLHAPYSLTDIVGKGIALGELSLLPDTNNTTFVWDILAKP